MHKHSIRLKRLLFFAIFISIYSSNSLFGQASIKGVIYDKKTKETLIGATILLKGTTIGASSDLDGNFYINNLKSGEYSVIVSYISYKPQIIEDLVIKNGLVQELIIELEPDMSTLSGIRIVSRRRTDTEMSMLSSIKANLSVANGVSSQQIRKSQDSDAADVIRRIPGVTLIEGRFVMVRGLSQRYNNVILNGAPAPSTESDIKAFDFELIPSSMLDNILIYKSPFASISNDFAGAAIEVSTKNNSENDQFSIGYSTAYKPDVTFKSYNNYTVGKLDWLGFDNGARSLSSNFPEHIHDVKDKTKLEDLGKSMNQTWSAKQSIAKPSQRFDVNYNKMFKMGKSSVTSINYASYSYDNDIRNAFRADYQAFNSIEGKSDTSYFFNDLIYNTSARINALSNWGISFGKNQRIEFKNLYNHLGNSKYIDRQGRDNYSGLTLKARELTFSERSIYSGQLLGNHDLISNKLKFKWAVGYSFANKNQPDQKRITSILVEDQDNPNYGMYGVNFSFAATPELSGRVFQKLNENIYSSNFSFNYKFNEKELSPEVTTGFHSEMKNRNFSARNIGYAIANFAEFDWSLPYKPIDEIFSNENINNTTGIKIDETTNKSDSYKAENVLVSGFVSLKLPISKKFSLQSGVRLEDNTQSMYSFSSDNASKEVNKSYRKLDFFPSANLVYNLTEKDLLRFAYGKTVNRPEFRELAPYAYYNFELKKMIRGNTNLNNAYIHNFDIRYERYPEMGEMIALGLFYKKFNSPIETVEINSGSGKDYTFQNAIGAVSYGAEFEIRKSLASINKLDLLKNISVVANASVIRSEIKIDTTLNYAKQSNRNMQGQSPFIVNLGVFYQNDKINLDVSVLYNVIGKRVVVVGLDTPDIYEMPRNVVDLTIVKNIGKKISIKAGIKDILNQSHLEKQFVSYTDKQNSLKEINEVTYKSKPGTVYSVGVVYSFFK